MQPDIVLLNHFVLCSICLVVYVYTICMHTPLGVNMSFCVCVCVFMHKFVCVYWMRMAPHPDGPLLGKERGGGSLGGRIKRNASNPLKLMTVCLSEWIYLSQMPQKLALKWFWWQTSPWISPMADTQMFMFTELEQGVQKGTLVWGRVMGRESICGVGR